MLGEEAINKKIKQAATLRELEVILRIYDNELSRNQLVDIYKRLKEIDKRIELNEALDNFLTLLFAKTMTLFAGFSIYQLALMCNVLRILKIDNTIFQRNVIEFISKCKFTSQHGAYILANFAHDLSHSQNRDIFWENAILNLADAFVPRALAFKLSAEDEYFGRCTLIRTCAQMACALMKVPTKMPRWVGCLNYIKNLLSASSIEFMLNNAEPVEIIVLANSMAALETLDPLVHNALIPAVNRIASAALKLPVIFQELLLHYLYFIKAAKLVTNEFNDLVSQCGSSVMESLNSGRFHMTPQQNEIHEILEDLFPHFELKELLFSSGMVVYSADLKDNYTFEYLPQSHYYFEKDGYHLKRQANFKAKMLTAYGWNVIQIPFYEWDLLNIAQKAHYISRRYTQEMMTRVSRKLGAMVIDAAQREPDKEESTASYQPQRHAVLHRELNPDAPAFTVSQFKYATNQL